MKSRIVLAFCVMLLLTGSLSAGTTVFNGAVDELWSNEDNWTEGFPGSGDKFRVGAELCILDYDAGVAQNGVWEGGPVGTLQLVEGAVLSVSQWSIIGYPSGGDADNRYTLEVLGGVYNGGIPERPNDGRIFVGRQGFAHLIVDHSGRVNLLHQDMQVGQGDGGDGLVDLRGGILDCDTRRLRLQTNANATAHVDFSGGTLKQRYSEGNLAEINGWYESGMITAYGGVGTLTIEELNEDEDPETIESMLVKGLHPLNPVPEDGDNVVPGALTLNWTLPDPCTPGQSVPVDVYFTDDLQALKSFINPDAIRVIGNQNTTSVTVQVQPKTRYYWAVDTYQGTENDPVWGPIFEVYVDNIAPEVKTIGDVTTWVENGTVDVALGGTVTDLDPTTTTWTVITEPNEGAAVIADAAQIDATVTLTAVGMYVLELQADDGEKLGTDTLTVNVYADSCLAAQSLPEYVPLVGDLDEDCDVDQDDMDLLMANWLECVALGDCDPNGL